MIPLGTKIMAANSPQAKGRVEQQRVLIALIGYFSCSYLGTIGIKRKNSVFEPLKW